MIKIQSVRGAGCKIFKRSGGGGSEGTGVEILKMENNEERLTRERVEKEEYKLRDNMDIVLNFSNAVGGRGE
jgi:hypothetical protein